MVSATLPEPAINHSVQQFRPPNDGTEFVWTGYIQNQYDLIPPWGYSPRDVWLRRLWYNVHHTLIQGAIAGIIMKVRSTPYEISGGRNLTRQWQDIFFESEFSEGYDVLMDKFLQDLFTQSFGGVFEIIGRGRPDKPLVGQVEGVAHLDALNCRASGNPEFPVVYFDPESGKTHRMHHTRVARITDLASPHRLAWGRGLSILERAIATATAANLLSRHEIELLSNQPPTGIVTISGINQTQWADEVKNYNADSQSEGTTIFRRLMQLVSINPGHEVKVNFTPFSTLPEDFDYEKFMNQHVNLLALGIGVDPQDIWPLTGAPLGSGAQSRILASKGEAKTYGSTLRRLERFFNSLLPRSLEWKFKPNDRERERADADTAKVWVEVATSLSSLGVFNSEMAARFVANNVEAVADVVLDESGQVRLPDDDPKDDTQIADDAVEVAPETEQIMPDAAPAPDVRADDAAALESKAAIVRQAHHFKDYQATQTEFVRALTDLIQAGMNSDVNRRRFGTVLRANLSRLGRKAYQDGLDDGGAGVGDDGLSEDDLAEIATVLAEQNTYVAPFADSIFSGTQVNAEARATMWANKSLDAFYQRGLLSADRNGLYEWRLGSTEQHCDDCLRLNGQKHRLKDWHKKGWIPRSQKLACKGFNCDCDLFSTKGRASGRY